MNAVDPVGAGFVDSRYLSSGRRSFRHGRVGRPDRADRSVRGMRPTLTGTGGKKASFFREATLASQKMGNLRNLRLRPPKIALGLSFPLLFPR
jgi:hypothetical protein